ncbi:MAG: Fur family transcriptional regulator [Nitrospiraceae bacterium]
MKTPTQHLLEKSVKVTAQRAAVLEFLQGNLDHPSPDEVYRKVHKRFPYISRATVYNTLKTLVKAGMLQEVLIQQDKTRVDPNTSRHHHFKCLKCKTVEDMPYDLMTADRVRTSLKAYRVTDVRMVIEGLCARCRRTGGASKRFP